MRQFLAIYSGDMNGAAMARWQALDEQERDKRKREGMAAWGEWMTRHADVITNAGGPLGKTKQVSANGVEDIKNQMTGYVVVSAASHEDAAAMFADHPHFKFFPGESVEIMQCMQMPGTA
tara:strand:+ start:587 stop:946 length:360 start_codon:yes stop_codon:yes gene_type:complete